MRIGGRLILNTVLIAFFSVVLTSVALGWLAYFTGGKVIEQEAKQHFVSLRETKKEEIERYFALIKNQISSFSNDLMIVDAMEDFKKSFKTYKSELGHKDQFNIEVVRKFLDGFVDEFKKRNGAKQVIDTERLLNFNNESSFLLQYNYIIENPYPVIQKYLLDTVDDGTEYSKFHKKYHPLIRAYMEKFGFYDVFLVDSETGNVVYTVHKEVDFASQLTPGGLSTDTGLGKVFRAAQQATKPGETFIADFEPYLPSFNDEAAFISTPIYKEGKQIGVLIFQFPVDVLNNIMTYERHWADQGLGKTGETYLVGPDFRQRSMSRFFIESPTDYLALMKKIGLPEEVIHKIKDRKTTIGLQPVITNGTEAVFKTKESGFGVFKDYRNILVLSAYAPLDIPGLNWAIMSEIDVSEAYQAVHVFSKQIVSVTLIVMVVGIVFSIIIGAKLNNAISLPIEKLNNRIRMIAKDMDLTKNIPVTSTDEVGEMGIALNQLLDSFRETCQLAMDSTKKVRSAQKELRSLSKLQHLTKEERDHKLVKTEASLQALSSKLNLLAGQFKILEEESEEKDEW